MSERPRAPELVVGVDASRNRSGGAVAHLRGILDDLDPALHGVREVHVWSYRRLLDQLPGRPWLIKHNPAALEKSLFWQVWWQYRALPREVRASGCDILLNTDAGTVCSFRPSVVMSRDLLSYEAREMQRYGLSAGRLRCILLKFIQTRSLRRSDGAIFLTNYAATTIQAVTGRLPTVRVIPHGVGSNFRQATASGRWPDDTGRPIECLYVSNAEPYKHQWHVIRAVGTLRARGHNVTLALVGGGTGRSQQLIDDEIARTDPDRQFVTTAGFVRHENIPQLMAQADLFVFASSCENMPNTLIEAMASGLPIACSDRGPMPEILEEAGSYFDPENAEAIANAIERIIVDPGYRLRIAKRAKELAEQFSWRRCARETFDFIGACVPTTHRRGRDGSDLQLAQRKRA